MADAVTFDDLQNDRLCSTIVKMIRRLETLPVKPGIRKMALESLRKNLMMAVDALFEEDDELSGEDRADRAALFFEMENVGAVSDDAQYYNVNGMDSESLNDFTRRNLLKCSRELGAFDLSVDIDIWRVVCNFNEILAEGVVRERLESVGAPEEVKDYTAYRYFSLLYAVRMEYGYGLIESLVPSDAPDELESILEKEGEKISSAYNEYIEESEAVTDFIYACLSCEA